MPTPTRALASLLLLAAPLAACDSDGPAYDHELASYGFEKAHVARLPGGERLAVGSITGHDVTVQWGDDDGWTAPQKVADDPLWTHDMTLREHAGTAAVGVDFWTQKKLDDDYAPRRTRILVCRDHDCAEAPRPKQLSSAHVSRDGTLVSFGVDRSRTGFWEDGAFRTMAVSGLPSQSAHQPVADGSFLAIGAREEGQLCHYDLYAAPRGSVDFTLAARGPGYPDAKPCQAYSPDPDPHDPDRVGVYVDAAVDRLEFVRKDDEWSAVVPAVAPIAYRNTQGRSTIAPIQLQGPRVEILLGSPDLRRIVAQVRVSGTRAWSRPRTIAQAPAGHLCRWATGETSDQGSAMAIVFCYPRAFVWNAQLDNSVAPLGVVLATDDGKDWPSLTLARPRASVGRGPDHLLAQGAAQSYLWRRGFDDLQTIHLPTDPLWEQLSVVGNGTRLLRLSGNGDRSAPCRPGWTIADLDARRWPALTPLPARVQRMLGRGTCTFEAWWMGGDSFEGGVHGMDFEADLVLEPDGSGGYRIR